MRHLLINLGLGFFSLLVTILALEVVLRLAMTESASSLGWSDRPKYFYTPELASDHGGQVYPAEKSPNTFRIVVVGDSFTFAPYMQYDDAFPARLERMLNLNNSEMKAEVISFGYPGYSTSNEVELVKRAILLGADLILLQFTLNDAERKPYQPSGALLTTNPYGATVIRNERSNLAFSKLLNLVAVKLNTYRSQQDYVQYFFSLFENSKGVKALTKALDTMNHMCVSNNVPLVAITFPLFGTPLDASYPFGPIHQKVAGYFEERSIPNFDLFETYREVPVERLQVMPGDDFHPNEIAHRMAAEAVYAYLAKTGKLPEPLLIKNVFRLRRHVQPTSEDALHRDELRREMSPLDSRNVEGSETKDDGSLHS